jgi:hypothetical protein
VPGRGVLVGLTSWEAAGESPRGSILDGGCFGWVGTPVEPSYVDRGRAPVDCGSRACAAADLLSSFDEILVAGIDVGGASCGGEICGVSTDGGGAALMSLGIEARASRDPEGAGVSGGVCTVEVGGVALGEC